MDSKSVNKWNAGNLSEKHYSDIRDLLSLKDIVGFDST